MKKPPIEAAGPPAHREHLREGRSLPSRSRPDQGTVLVRLDHIPLAARKQSPLEVG